MNKIIVICGPTASGKSALAIELAKKLDTEIISADSLAIYKGLDIGTAKPTKEEQSEVKHHLIDVVDAKSNFSVSDYENLALPIVEDLLSKGKTPIICGGTGFYINSILYKFGFGGTAQNLEIREKYQNLLETKGVDYVYDELVKVDKESAEKIHKNNVKRVIRALEIFYSTGTKKSSQDDKMEARYPFIALTPKHDREVLYNRINMRVDKMLDDGLIDEVKGLIDNGIDKTYQCMQGIGYKETYDAIINNDFSSLAEEIKLNTRHYAKRQITFFKHLEGLQEVDINTFLNKDIILLLK